ncbi:MAG TPA: GntR family transcriptional regulator [Oceanospirillaceae bacterium]|nr:GntR family transcriptional regulator [Oceanospirillaceae bacterium]
MNTAFANIGQTNSHLNGQVAREIATKILSGEIAEGETLPSEPVLCEKMGVSRTAFREAIKILYSKGMVESKPRVGTRVRCKTNWNFLDVQLLEWMVGIETKKDIYLEFLDLRKAIEPQACAFAAERATKEQRIELTTTFQRMCAIAEDFDQDQWIETDAQFHRMIFISSGNSFYVPFGNVLVAMFKWFILFSSKDGGVCIDEHREIYDAIMAGDSTRAFKASQSLMQKDKHGLGKSS